MYGFYMKQKDSQKNRKQRWSILESRIIFILSTKSARASPTYA
ncbi:hypothetical protein FLAV_02649 [Flavobacteriales bacterium]|nr:hypothetical protein FLAV_02649 [Flavobacteriales bacterium]